MIDIYYRTTSHRNEKDNRPHWFSFEKSWNNLLNTRQDNPITILHDGPVVDDYFKSLPENCKLVEINSQSLLPTLELEWEEKNEYYDDHDENGNVYRKRMEKPDLEKASGALMWDYIYSNLNTHNIIYIIEDDYLHLANWPIIIEDIFSIYNDLHYICLYDHPDKYSPRYKGLMSQIILGRYCHWRTVPSICGTFAVKGQVLFEDLNIHIENLGDYNKFIKLKEKNRHFISALPSIATHCIEPFLSPYINWEGVINA